MMAKRHGERTLRLIPRPRVTSGAPAAVSADREHPARWSRPNVRTIAIASGKGGVGKSTVAANLAVALGERGARVLLLDADFSQANLDLLLGLHPRYDLQHVLAGERTLEEIVVSGPPGVKLIPAASGVPELAELDDFRRETLLRSIGLLDQETDLVIMDLATGVSHQVTSFCRSADDVIVVCTPEMPAFSDAYGLIKLLHTQGLVRAPHLLVNMSGGAEEAEETAQRVALVAKRFLELQVGTWGAIPFDPAVARAVRRQEPVVNAFPNAPAALAYRALAERLWPVPDPEERAEVPIERLEA